MWNEPKNGLFVRQDSDCPVVSISLGAAREQLSRTLNISYTNYGLEILWAKYVPHLWPLWPLPCHRVIAHFLTFSFWGKGSLDVFGLMSFENLRVHHEISLLAHLRFGESWRITHGWFGILNLFCIFNGISPFSTFMKILQPLAEGS